MESLDYLPVSSIWQAKRSAALGVDVIKLLPSSTPRTVSVSEPPSNMATIREDGNCFFQSLAHLLTGVEADHKVLCQVIVNHTEENEATFIKVANCSNYTQESDMSLPGEWATEVEVTAAATPRKVACHCLGSGQQRWR